MNVEVHKPSREGPVRVLQVLEATTGGTARHMRDLMLYLDRTRFAPSLICSMDRDPAFQRTADEIRATGAPVHVVRMTRSPSPAADLVALRTLRRFLNHHAVDLVHAHSSKAGFLARLAARDMPRVKTLYTPHAFAFQMKAAAWRRGAYRALERLAVRWTDAMVCVSHEEQQHASTLVASRDCRIRYIPNGVHVPEDCDRAELRAALLADLNLPPPAELVGAIGRLTAQKGIRYLVEAAALLASGRPDLHILITGDGEERDSLAALARQRGIENRVHLLGKRSDAERVAGGLDLLAMPSLWEGIPYSLLDAMARGTPPVASRVGGIPDAVIDGQTGHLVPPESASSLADAMAALLDDPSRRERMGTAARQRIIERFSMDRMIRDIETLYLDGCTRDPR